MTVKEAANKWSITPRRVQELIRAGRIPGVQKLSDRIWVMPDDTLKPKDLRLERYKKNDATEK